MSNKVSVMDMKQKTKHELKPRLRFPEFQDAPKWEEKSLGEVATFYNGRAYKQEELLDQGKYRVLRVGNFFTNNNWYYSDLELDEAKYCDNGDLLYAWSASFGPRIWQGEKVIYHYHIWKVVGRKNINKNFLFLVLDYETEKIKFQSANGLGLLHITKSTIERWKCNFPAIKEQQKIADCLASVDKLIAAQSRKLDALKAHKKGLLQQLFPAEGETVPKLRLREFSGKWSSKKISEISNKISDGIHATPEYDEEGEYFFINGNNLFQGRIVLSQTTKKVNRNEFLKHRRELDNSTILMSINGTIGNLAFYNNELIVIGKSACYLNFKNGFDKRFIYFLLQTNPVIRHFEAELTGSTIKNLSIATIKNTTLSIPSFSEQQKIADCLTSLDELITAQSQKLDALKAHKKGLLQQLFPSPEEVQA